MSLHASSAHLRKARLFILFFAGVMHGLGQEVFINEIHYENAGVDQHEGVEIAGPAGFALGDHELAFYNGSNGEVYLRILLSGVLPDEGGAGFGTRFFEIPGIQNGSPDGLALVRRSDGAVVQFLGYEGEFGAADGPAGGLWTTPIAAAEDEGSSSTHSLQLQGTGSRYEDFAWHADQPRSPNLINADQHFTGAAVERIDLLLSATSLDEGAGEAAARLDVFLEPPPSSSIRLFLNLRPPDRLSVPGEIRVDETGQTSVFVDVIDNAQRDLDTGVTLTVVDPESIYRAAAVEIHVRDDDPPPVSREVLRVASFNVLNGVGPANSVSFDAAKRILARIHPDVIAFQEVSASGNFGHLGQLLEQLGYKSDSAHFAARGEGFEGAAPSNGDFIGDQHVVLASRYPITRAVQIGRGAADRREMGRYPLFVRIDVPWSREDPALVAVHLKAGSTLADQFRRAVEACRIREFLADEGLTSSTNLMILGDFNEEGEGVGFQPASFASEGIVGGYRFPDGSTLPATYRLGDDLAQEQGSLPYGPFPQRAFAEFEMVDLRPLQADGRSPATFNRFPHGTLDYLLVNPAWRARGNLHTEIFNSEVDTIADGLEKSGVALERSASALASDHHVVFADLPLDTLPRLSLELAKSRVGEGEAAVVGTVRLTEPSENDVLIRLRAGSPGHARLSLTELLLAKGSDSATFAVNPIDEMEADPDHRLTVRASASGYSTALAFLDVLNDDSSGRMLISRYREPGPGASGKAIELVNNTASAIDFVETPLEVLIYADGSSEPLRGASLRRGWLGPGAVLVAGDQTVGNYLRHENLLHEDLVIVEGGDQGRAYLRETGEAVFLEKVLPFNGDDAIEIRLGRSRSDVFGEMGTDPGRGWMGNGVSTVDGTLALQPLAAFGSNGFTDPATRFVSVPFSEGLAGFGLAPDLDPAYRDWLAEAGLSTSESAFHHDPDQDGLTNLVEFVFTTDPGARTPRVFTWFWEGQERLRVQFRRRAAAVSVSLEVSNDLRSWEPAGIPVDEEITPDEGDIRLVTWIFPPSRSGSRYHRLRVALSE